METLIPETTGYTSPFEFINMESFTLSYSGNLQSVINEELDALQSSPYSSANKLALHPPRIIRAIIDCRIENFQFKGMEEIQSMGVDLALKLYRYCMIDPQRAQFELEAFIASLKSFNPDIYNKLMQQKILQRDDKITRMAYNPRLSETTVHRIRNSHNLQNGILFLVIGHGGIPAGLDVYLRLNPKDSILYPFRFSRNKLHDKNPQITDEQESLLIRLQRQYPNIFLFDEDMASGKTMEETRKYLRGIFPYQRIDEDYNFDDNE
jgi:hypothetical protein